jgi:hypothetical protein
LVKKFRCTLFEWTELDGDMHTKMAVEWDALDIQSYLDFIIMDFSRTGNKIARLVGMLVYIEN